MRRTRLLAATAILFLAPLLALAHHYEIGPLQIGHPWSRATPPGAQVAVGFLSVDNTGKAEDRLIGVTTSAADRVEIHEMRMDGNMMRMRQLTDGVALPAGKQTTLAPGGYHLMFMKPKQAWKAGDHIKATLQFAKAGKVDVEFSVAEAGATPKPAAAAPAADPHAGH